VLLPPITNIFQSVILVSEKTIFKEKQLLHFIKYNSNIMCKQVKCAPEFHNDFGAKKLFLYFKNNFTRINHCKFIHHKSHLKPFLIYLPWIVRRECFSIIFNVKKCTLYSIGIYTLSLILRSKKTRLYLDRLRQPVFVVIGHSDNQVCGIEELLVGVHSSNPGPFVVLVPLVFIFFLFVKIS
jgi:hypothetical protein